MHAKYSKQSCINLNNLLSTVSAVAKRGEKSPTFIVKTVIFNWRRIDTRDNWYNKWFSLRFNLEQLDMSQPSELMKFLFFDFFYVIKKLSLLKLLPLNSI